MSAAFSLFRTTAAMSPVGKSPANKDSTTRCPSCPVAPVTTMLTAFSGQSVEERCADAGGEHPDVQSQNALLLIHAARIMQIFVDICRGDPALCPNERRRPEADTPTLGTGRTEGIHRGPIGARRHDADRPGHRPDPPTGDQAL